MKEYEGKMEKLLEIKDKLIEKQSAWCICSPQGKHPGTADFGSIFSDPDDGAVLCVPPRG